MFLKKFAFFTTLFYVVALSKKLKIKYQKEKMKKVKKLIW